MLINCLVLKGLTKSNIIYVTMYMYQFCILNLIRMTNKLYLKCKATETSNTEVNITYHSIFNFKGV